MAENTFRYEANGRFYFGDKYSEQWSAEVDGHATGGEAYNYLVHVCPTTALALAKLRAIRKAARASREKEKP